MVIVVVRHLTCFERFRSYRADLSHCTNEMCLFFTIQTDRCGRVCLFDLLVAHFECECRVCVCILVVVRHIVYCQRFSGFRADVSCCTTNFFFNNYYTDRQMWSHLIFSLIVYCCQN